jgi:hypothetical protein
LLTTGHQLKAGRAIAGMDQDELAERANVHLNTVCRMEAAGAGPIAGRAVNVRAVRAALKATGVEFTNGAGARTNTRGASSFESAVRRAFRLACIP